MAWSAHLVLLLMGLDDSAPRRTMLSSSGRRAQFLLLDPCCVPGTGSRSNYELCCAAPLVDQLYNAFLIGSPPRFFSRLDRDVCRLRRGRGPVTDPCLRAGHPWATVTAGQVLARCIGSHVQGLVSLSQQKHLSYSPLLIGILTNYPFWGIFGFRLYQGYILDYPLAPFRCRFKVPRTIKT